MYIGSYNIREFFCDIRNTRMPVCRSGPGLFSIVSLAYLMRRVIELDKWTRISCLPSIANNSDSVASRG